MWRVHLMWECSTNKLGLKYRASLFNTLQSTLHIAPLNEKPQTLHTINYTTTGAACSQYSTLSSELSVHPILGLKASNVPSQQFDLSKDTFRWTFERAKIDFNRLKILIFPVNNQETFPVGEQANQSLWEEVRVVQRGIWCGSQSTTLLSVALFTFRANGGKAQAQSPVSLR